MSNFLNKIVYLTQDQYDSLIAGTLVGHTYDPNTIYITDSSDAATVNGHTVAIDVPANALFTDTNKYHTSGSWSNLTYTATAINGAEALTFTIPTGSTAATVAVGNHNHNGTYIKTISSTENAIVRFNNNNGEVKNSIVTIEDNGDISINAIAGGAPSLTLQRGTVSDAYTDWKIVDTGGKLSFQSRSGNATWTERASFADNSGNFTITGTMTASSFSGSGASLTNLPSDKLTGTISMDRIAAGVITPAKLDSTSTITIGTQAIKVGGSFTISTLVTDLGLSKALRFIGTVASNSSYIPSDGTSGKPTITGLSSYIPAVGDVILDSDNDAEYVCISVSGTTYIWELLGRSSSWATSDHTHGNISNNGTIGQTSNWTLANGDGLVVFDASNSNKLERTGITFDGSTKTKALTPAGTWETFNNYIHPTTSGNKHIPSGGSSGQILGWSADGTATWIGNSDTDTHRIIKVNDAQILASNTTALNLKAGDNITINATANNGDIIISATDTTYESKAAASGGTAVSLVTTGEKYTWNQKLSSHGPSYGKVTVSAQSDAVSALTKQTAATTPAASSANETLKFTTANKWIIATGTNSSTAGSDEIKIAHLVPSSITNSGPTGAQTPSYGATFDIPVISIDEAGHITGISASTVKIPASDNVDTKLRIYLSTTNIELPLVGLNSGNATAAYASHTSGTKDVYGAIPSTTTNRATINPSTGKITVPGGIVGDLNGNADTVSHILSTTTKYYVSGTTLTESGDSNIIFDTGIYTTAVAGQLNATTYMVNEKVTLQWNSTDSSLDFIFT